LRQDVLELVCACQAVQLLALLSVFARTFQTYRTSFAMSTPYFLILREGARPSRAAQNIKERPAIYARTTRVRRRLTPGSCNGLFSVGFPTGAQGHLPHLTQRTSSITLLPTSLTRAGRQATGRLYCNFLFLVQLSKSSTGFSQLQAVRLSFVPCRLQLFENSNDPVIRQA
jgi:hypothetical protein